MLIDLTSSPADPLIAELRAREFARLDASNLAYLDYAGSALHADSQIVAHQARLRSAVLGNPHSEHEPSRASSRVIARARDAVLKFFGVTPATHAVCFTANATAAIKLVAESYPFAPGTACVLSTDNHNSVNGIREIARRRGAAIRYLPLDADLRLLDADAQLSGCTSAGGGLFAYPAQSNFSGVRHPLGLVGQAHSLGFDVLLDAAAFAPANALSLRACPADFVAVSFYKIFGYPTGVGALIARRDALRRLRRPWFSGGTIEYASVQAAMHRLHDGEVAFEDGTPNFLGISAIEDGFAFIERIGLDRIRAHVERLTGMLLEG